MKAQATRTSDENTAAKKTPGNTPSAPSQASVVTPYDFAGMNVFPFPGGIVRDEVVNPLPPIDRGPVILYPSIALGYQFKGGLKGVPVYVGPNGVQIELQSLVNTISVRVNPKGEADAITFKSKVPGLPTTSVQVGVEATETGGVTVSWVTQAEFAKFSDSKSNLNGTLQLTYRVRVEKKGSAPAPEPVLIPVPDRELQPAPGPSWSERLVKQLVEILEFIAKAVIFVAVVALVIVAIILALLVVAI